MRDNHESERVVPRAALVALAALFVAALGWRLVGLNAEGLWNDELFTAHVARSDWRSALALVRGDVHPPLYFVLVWLWAGIAGDSEVALRLPSVVFGALVVPSVFALGTRMSSWQTGLLSATFSAVLYTPWYQSQEARPYSLALLLACWVGYFAYGVFVAVRKGRTPARTDLWGFAFCGWALAATHYFGLLFVCLVGALLGISAARNASGSRVLIALTAMAALYAPWVPVLLVQMRKRTYIEPPTWETLDQIAGVLFNAFSGLQALVLVLAVVAYLKHKKSHGTHRGLAPEALLGLWIVVPLGVAFVKSLVSTPVLTPKSMIVAVPAALVLLGRMCESLFHRFTGSLVAALGLALASLGADLHFSGQFARPTRAQFREAGAYVASRWDGTSELCAVAWDARNFEYYLTPPSERMAQRRGAASNPRVLQVSPEALHKLDLGSLAGGSDSFWLLQGDFPIPDEVYSLIQSRCDRLDRAEFYLTKVTLYRWKHPIARRRGSER